MHHSLPFKLFAVVALLVLLPLAHASILGNGSSVPPTPLFPGGTLVATMSGTITAATLTVDFVQWIYADPSNTWCVGCLDFVYQFTNHGPDSNERYSMSSYEGFLLDVGTNPFGIHDPTLIDRSGLGPVVAFNFPAADEIVPGETTVLLVIETDARYYMYGYVSVEDGTAGSAVAYAPNPIPEPASLMLVGGSLMTAAAALRRKFLR